MSIKLYPTLNDLNEQVRARMVVLLNQSLADILDLGMQVKFAHWNVKGPNFIALHELYDSIVGELEDLADDLAERAVELGGVARGLIADIAERSTMTPYAAAARSGHDHNAALAKVLALFGAGCRAAIGIATDAGDADTADLFTQASRALDKLLWKIEAHHQADD